MAYKFNPFTGNLDDSGNQGAATPGGSNTQIQFNDSGSLGGDVDLTWNKTTNVMTLKGDLTLDDNVAGSVTTLQTITPTQNNTISLPNATGTVALVAGSSGQLLWNNAGANAGASTLTYDGSILTTSGRFINSYNSGSLAPAKAFTGTWATGAGTTNTKPHVLIETTGATSNNWSNSGTGFGVNAASGFAGNLLDLQVNGTSRAVLTGAGRLGVGTTSPLDVLDVASVSPSVRIRSTDGSGSSLLLQNNDTGTTLSDGLYLGIDSSEVGYLWNFENQPIAFATNNTERARIDSSGRLLVGTVSNTGGSLLQVNDNRIRIATAKTPASATDTGSAGEVCWDASYIYVCTATNTWKRAALATW